MPSNTVLDLERETGCRIPKTLIHKALLLVHDLLNV